MNRTRQDNPAKPATVEPDATVDLPDAALDQAAGGAPTAGEVLTGIDFRPANGFYGTGVYKTTDGGRVG